MTDSSDTATVSDAVGSAQSGASGHGHGRGHGHGHGTARRGDDPGPPSAREAGPENHLALVYDSFDEQLAAVVPFVRQGLERGERVLYIAHQNDVADVANAFASAGIDVEAARESGALTFHTKADTYERFGAFDAERMIEYLDEIVTETVAGEQFGRVRITGEMTWALDDGTDTLDALVEYEAKVNEYYPEQPVTGLCQYDRSAFPPDLLYDVIRAHPHQVYNATVCQNFAYLPPEEFFGAAPPAVDAEQAIDSHLDRLRTQSTLHRREETLSALASSSQNLLEGDEAEVIDHTVRTIEQVLDPSLVAVFEYDEAADDLQPEVVTVGGGAANPESVALPPQYREQLWDAFVADEPRVFENFQSGATIPGLSAVLQSGIVLPVDRHGVLLVGSTQAYAFDEADTQFVATLATTTISALDRVEREHALTTQNEQLEHLSRLNRVIRSVDQAVIRAPSRAAVEREVCTQLTDSDFYRFAWIGGRDPIDESFEVHAWAGEGERFLDDVRVSRPDAGSDGPTAESPTDETVEDSPAGADDADGADGAAGADGADAAAVVNGPERAALLSGETQLVTNALTDTMFAEWRRAALDAGFQSCISIPLQQADTDYGVLNLYAAEPHTFTGMEREILTELGSTIAFAIDAAETRAGVHAERTTELRLRITDESSWLLRLARAVEARLSVETVLPGEGDRVRLFFTATDADRDDVLAFAGETVNVETVRHIADADDDALFEAVLTGQTIGAAVASRRAAATLLVADEHGVTVQVELPQTRSPRAFVESLAEEYPGLSVESIRRVNQPVQTAQSFFATLEERLTPKQLEALQVAYFSGYFEWPRESDATDIATALGISQPTFSGHLRAGQRKLFSELFDP